MEMDKILKTLYKLGSTLYDPVPRPENNEGMSDEALALAISILERIDEEKIGEMIFDHIKSMSGFLNGLSYDHKSGECGMTFQVNLNYKKLAQAIVRELKGE